MRTASQDSHPRPADRTPRKRRGRAGPAGKTRAAPRARAVAALPTRRPPCARGHGAPLRRGEAGRHRDLHAGPRGRREPPRSLTAAPALGAGPALRQTGVLPPPPGSRPLPGFPGGFRAVAEARWPDGISEPRDPSARPPRAPPRVLRPPARPGSGASPHFRRPAACVRGGSGAPPAGSSRCPRPRFPQKRKAGPAVLGPDRVPP